MKHFFKLTRVKHYVKNCLVFLPMFFGGVFFEKERIINAILGFIAFSTLSSVVYIINDIKDIEKDRKHETKKNRPLASGAISITTAVVIAVVLLALTLLCSFFIHNYMALAYLLVYLLINIFDIHNIS